MQRLSSQPVAVVIRAQADIFRAELDEIIFEHLFIFQIFFLLAALYLVQWRLGDIEIAFLDQVGHLSVKERQQ